MTEGSTIRILPEKVANQIAAGEVVQRPASVVKELLENAIDAGAGRIDLIVEDAGRTLIQVSDDGEGMTADDLELAFERHATSKIKTAEDLFQLVTMGFRGEALASIAAVAQVNAHTRRAQDESGWTCSIEGGKRVESARIAARKGTRISVRNLFFNIPARRNFLKSDNVEFRHICDEFQRVAFAHPQVRFALNHNGSIIYNLPSGNFRQRIVAIMGLKFDQKLVPVEESTPLLTLSGFVGKPEFARKTRGEQFLFVNDRFVKSPSLHHAVGQAFEGLITEGRHPAYFVKLQIDPKHIDINIHPTKTEIKFDDERTVYSLMRVAVKHALGQYSVSPSIDFNVEPSFRVDFDPNRPVRPPSIRVNPDYNPFSESPKKSSSAHLPDYSETIKVSQSSASQPQFLEQDESFPIVRWADKYLIQAEDERLRIIDLFRSHEHILYQQNIERLGAKEAVSQQLLFPQKLEMGPQEIATIEKLLPKLLGMGFDIEIGETEIEVNGLPFGMAEEGTKDALDELLEWELHADDIDENKRIERMSAAFAKAQSIRPGQRTGPEEHRYIFQSLSRLNWPERNWKGKRLWWEILPSAMEDVN